VVITSLQAARTNANFQFCSLTIALLGAVSDQLGTLGPRRERQRHTSGYGRCGVMATYSVWQSSQICGYHKSTSCTDECEFPVLRIYNGAFGGGLRPASVELGTLGPRREHQRHMLGYGRCGVMAVYPRWQSTQICRRAGRGGSAAPGRSGAAFVWVRQAPPRKGTVGAARIWRRSHTASVGASHRQR
jgi:hypothetical protein